MAEMAKNDAAVNIDEMIDRLVKNAQQALKALGQAKRPDGGRQAVWADHAASVEHGCYDLLGKYQYSQHKWQDAIESFQKALQNKLYDECYFYIGQAQLHLEDVDNALLSFAKAEYLGGNIKAQATKYLEETYKGQHNQSLIGIDKKRNTARLEIEALRKQMVRRDG
jgi:tetratricopeptide (TPR) repeat protein